MRDISRRASLPRSIASGFGRRILPGALGQFSLYRVTSNLAGASGAAACGQRDSNSTEGAMDLKIVKRLALIVMALFPALWGLLGDLNNVTDFTGTAYNAVKPMIEMTNTYGNPW